MRNKTVYAIIAIFLIQAFSASLAVIPAQNDVDLFFPESSDTSARNNSSGGGNTTGGGNSTGGGNTTGGGNSTGGGNTTGGGNSTGGGNTTGGGNSTGGGNTTGGGNNTGGGNTTGGGNNTGGGNTGGGNGMANNNSSGSGGGTGGVKPGGNTSGGNGTSSNNTANTNSSTNGSGTGGIKPGANNTNGTGNNTNGSGMAGTTPWNPLLPVLICDDIPWNDTNITANITIDDCLNSTSDFWFWFNQSGSLVWVDPIVATGYDFVVYSGPEMVTVEIPPGYGDDVFDLYLHDGTDWYDTNIDIAAGVSYTFQSPVDRMSIRGIEAYEMLDPNDPTAFVAGITYASSGSVLMTMTPVTTNYTLPACGTDPSLTDLMIWTDLQTYQQGSTTYADYYVNCSVNTKDYELHVFAYSTSGTSWSDFQVWNWTETDSYESMDDDWSNLSPSTYCINATLYMVSGTAYQFVDFEVTCFTVVGNNGGGGGGGTTIDPCGLNSSYTVVASWSDAQTYNYGEDQNMSFYVNCTRLGESYTLEYFVYEINAPNNFVASGAYSWTATNIWESWNDVVTGLLPGDYCVDTDLYQANVYLTSGYSFYPHCFDVTGVSVNSPPTLTQTSQALVAYADDPLNCYDNGMYYTDPNNDPDQSVITWFVNNAQVATGVQALLPAGTVSVGDQLSCEATAHDGFMAGNTVTRSYYVLPSNNSAPSVSAITISPTSPEETDTLTCTYTYMDPDNDPDASIIIWSINGVATTTQGATLSTGYTTADFVTCSVTAFDGSSAGNTGTGTVLIMSPGGGSTPTIGVLGTLAVLSVAFILISRKELED